MQNYKPGDENEPLAKANHWCPIYVIIRNLKAENEEDDVAAEFEKNLSNPDDRKWLGRMSYWCCNNHHSIETMSLKDAEGQT